MLSHSRTLFALLATAAISAAAAPRPAAAQTATPSAPAATRPAQTPVLAANTLLKRDISYGKADLQKLDLYAPKSVKNAPVLLFVHGGEWSRGSKLDISSKPKFFNEHGVIFVSTNYRLSPQDKHPAQVDDVAAAIGWVHSHIAEYGGDPSKIVIIGHSAGCHLVTYVALNPEPLANVGMKPSDLRGVVAWSGGMYDLVARANGAGMYPPYIKATFGEDAASQKAGSPLTYTGNAKSAPPFLIASVDDDKSQSSREASKLMLDAINAAGGHATSALLIGKTHFTANHELGAEGDKTGPMLLDFIHSVTR
jgi:acetyl esterase/lipase